MDGDRRDPDPPCPLELCDCHIGYVHLVPLGLYDVFTGGIIERIPALLNPAPGAATRP